MSTSKHFDKICLAIIALTLVITILFMCGSSVGIEVAASTMPYVSTIFDTSYVHQIDIEMNGWEDFIENCESEEYYPCTLVVDGEKYSNIAIRAKGNTSLSNVKSLGSQRYSFKFEFDHYESGKTLDGLDKLCLNNLIQDNTMMKDYLAYTLMSDFGVDSPLCSYVYLTVNGEDWGLYLAVEGIEDSFLERNYDSEGELYKPDSLSFGGGRGNGKDFDMSDFDFDTEDFDFSAIQNNFARGDNTENTSEDTSDSTEQNTNENNQFPQRGGMPNGEMPSGGFNQGGEIPSGDFNQDGEMPSGEFTPNGEMPSDDFNQGGEMPSGDFAPNGEMPNTDTGDTTADRAESTDGGETTKPNFSFNADSSNMNGGMNFGGGGGAGGGMGSDDVKLKYIDDDPDSYSNIFDNAKTDISSNDKERLIESLKNLSAYENIDDTVDTDEVLRYFVVHNFLCNGDSYTGSMIHNYYLYENDGQLSMIPWDYNLAFGTFQGGDGSSSVNASIDSPISGGDVDDRPMLGWIFSDETYTEEYHELFSDFIEKWFSDGELAALIEATAKMIRPYVEKDPTKFCTTEEFEVGVTAIEEFVTLRAEAVTRQLNGDSTAVDTSSLNVSDMGTMGGSMGGGDEERGDNNGGFRFDPSGEEMELPDGMTFPNMPGQTENISSDSTTIEEDSDNTTTENKPEIPSTDENTGNTTSESRPEKPSTDESTDKQQPNGQDITDFDFSKTQGSSLNSESVKWILVAASSLVMLIGLFIVIKKK